MTTYEGGVRVISMLRWPGVVKAGQVLNGMQAHMDMFTTLAAAAGVPNVNEDIRNEKKQYIDGVNNLDYWTGRSPESQRSHFLYYYESKLAAIRMGPWKFHFSTREHYYDNLAARTAPLVFNLRSDPFESYDSKDSFGHLAQRMSWLFQPMSELMEAHLRTLAEYPPVQGGTSFDLSNVVQEFLRRSKQ
jgi:arylsulfatase